MSAGFSLPTQTIILCDSQHIAITVIINIILTGEEEEDWRESSNSKSSKIILSWL